MVCIIIVNVLEWILLKNIYTETGKDDVGLYQVVLLISIYRRFKYDKARIRGIRLRKRKTLIKRLVRRLRWKTLKLRYFHFHTKRNRKVFQYLQKRFTQRYKNRRKLKRKLHYLRLRIQNLRKKKKRYLRRQWTLVKRIKNLYAIHVALHQRYRNNKKPSYKRLITKEQLTYSKLLLHKWKRTKRIYRKSKLLSAWLANSPFHDHFFASHIGKRKPRQLMRHLKILKYLLRYVIHYRNLVSKVRLFFFNILVRTLSYVLLTVTKYITLNNTFLNNKKRFTKSLIRRLFIFFTLCRRYIITFKYLHQETNKRIFRDRRYLFYLYSKI